ncbi:MAG: hypothetical protein RIM99_14645 [Cyclobacteriaceae bacterium]
MKKITITLITVLCFVKTQAQITIEPEEWLPCEEIKLVVDISGSSCTKLIGDDGPLYMWTWEPADPAVEGGNGQWTDSNEALQMTQESPNVWSFTMIPTEFYGVSADKVYETGFSLLVKANDAGTDGGCEELKTDDYHLDVAPPFTSQKLFALPKAVFSNDVFSFRYDNNLEQKTSMQNLTEVYVYTAAIAGGVEYPISTMGEVGNNPNLQMTSLGEGQFVFSIVPEDFFTGVPAGTPIDQLLFVARKKDMLSADDRVDEDAFFEIGCAAAGGGC